jgi:hypothetical protein
MEVFSGGRYPYLKEKVPLRGAFDAVKRKTHRHLKEKKCLCADQLNDLSLIGLYIYEINYFSAIFIVATYDFVIKKIHPTGFEPVTNRLEGDCSIQLSYGCVFKEPCEFESSSLSYIYNITIIVSWCNKKQ